MNKGGKQKGGAVLVLQGTLTEAVRTPKQQQENPPHPAELLPRNYTQHLRVQPPEL